MSTIASRDLRNHTARVLRQVAEGSRVTVTVNGTAVAEIGPVRSARPQLMSRSDLLEVLSHQADAALTSDLERLAGETTEGLGAP